jgi:urease accessory protein
MATITTIMITAMAGTAATTGTSTPIAMSLERGSLAKLLAWFSPAFPIGAFSYSHGLEWAVEAGDIADRASAERWIEDVLRFGAGATDAALLRHAHAAAEARDAEGLRGVAELAAAFQPSSERALESLSQGAAFLATVEAVWPAPGLAVFGAAWGGPVAAPVAAGVAAAAHGLAASLAAEAYLLAFTANLVSAAVRLVPLGQTDGQRIAAALAPLAAELAASRLPALDDLGAAALRSDLAAMRHETQHTRLFRS